MHCIIDIYIIWWFIYIFINVIEASHLHCLAHTSYTSSSSSSSSLQQLQRQKKKRKLTHKKNVSVRVRRSCLEFLSNFLCCYQQKIQQEIPPPISSCFKFNYYYILRKDKRFPSHFITKCGHFFCSHRISCASCTLSV